MEKALIQARYWRFDEKSVFPFGKHRGKTVLDVFEEEPSYIGFCLRNMPKFTLTSSGWNVLCGLNKAYFNQIENKDLFVVLVNKQLECDRILRENTHLCNMRKLPVSYFKNRIVFVQGAGLVEKTNIKRGVKSIKNGRVLIK